MEYPWTNLGSFIVAVGSLCFLIAAALLGAAFKLVVQLTRLEGKLDETARRLDVTYHGLADRIERLEAVVLPTVTETVRALSRAHLPSHGKANKAG